LKTFFLDVKFKGGVGNQLFQYANARSICLKEKIPFLLFNVDDYKQESLGRNFALLNYRVKGKLIKDNAIAKIFRSGTKANKFFSFLNLYGSAQENGFRKQRVAVGGRPLTSLIGYWQSDYYFKDIRSQLLIELKPLHTPRFPNWLEHADTVAVHVRRTDYLAEERYGFLGVNYYCAAIAKIKSLLPHSEFIFFSDDMDWCRSTFKEKGNIFFDEPGWEEDYLQLYAMSHCRHQVIANSSFSWWGAWLNSNDDKIIIRPAKPFRDHSLEHESYYPDDWISIDND
jgi:hypothetical protein